MTMEERNDRNRSSQSKIPFHSIDFEKYVLSIKCQYRDIRTAMIPEEGNLRHDSP